MRIGSFFLPPLGVIIVWAMLIPSAWAAPLRTATPEANLQTIRAFLALPDSQIDLARVKLSVDRMIDPTVDIHATLQQLDTMAAQVKTLFPANPSGRDKLEALRAYLYQPGPWNDNKPFGYDMDDPLGTNIRNKLLPTYLATRKGNCISMPLLFIILGQNWGWM